MASSLGEGGRGGTFKVAIQTPDGTTPNQNKQHKGDPSFSFLDRLTS